MPRASNCSETPIPQKFTWSFRQLNDYESYEVIDDYTMEFTLIEPIDRWANLFANHMPLAPDHLEAVGLDGYIEDPVGTGPYKFSSWQRDSYITLERWDDFPGDLPVIETVTFRHMPESAVRVAALRSNEIHVAAHVPPDQIDSLTADGFRALRRRQHARACTSASTSTAVTKS